MKLLDQIYSKQPNVPKKFPDLLIILIKLIVIEICQGLEY